MPLYSCAIVGTGTSEDPIRAPFDGNGSGWICLAPPGSTVGRGLLYLPTAQSDPRIRQIADDPSERASNQVRNAWQNELGITLQSSSTTSIAALIAEVMRDHGRTDGSRWGILRPSKQRQRFEIYLGALGAIWTGAAPPTPATQTFTESWPTDSTTISSGQDQSWTEVGDLEVSGGKIRCVSAAAGTFESAICNSTLDTENQYHEATYTLVVPGSGVNGVYVCCRFADESNNYFLLFRHIGGSPGRRIRKIVGGVETGFAADSTSPGTGGTMKLVVDGSTITGYKDGSVILGPATDGTPELLTNFNGGIILTTDGTTIGDATLDGHTIADIAVPGGGRRLRQLMGVGR